MSRARLAIALLVLTGCVSAPRVPERDLSQVRIGMSEADVAAVWDAPRTMYKIEPTAKGCVERHVYGVVAGSPHRPASVDFDARHRVCAVGPVDVPNTEAPRLAADMPAAPVVPAAPPPPAAVASPATTPRADDVVVLKNGLQLRGKLVDPTSPSTVTITLANGATKTIARAKIKRVDRGS